MTTCKKSQKNPCSKPFSVLIIDDHVTTCAGYISILENSNNRNLDYKFQFEISNTLLDAKEKIEHSISANRLYDFVFLDIKMPSEPEEQLFSGEDIGVILKTKCPKTKILILTGLTNPFRISSILKYMDPDGFILKGEITKDILHICIEKLVSEGVYYSKKTTRVIRNNFITHTSISFEDKKFLYLLSAGIPSHKIPIHLPWSQAKVNKKKRELREKLGVEEKNTFALVHQAKELGIV